MSSDQFFEVYTLELGPFSTISDLHREVSNQVATFATESCAREDEVAVSVSHSVLQLNGGYIASVIITARSTVRP